MPTFDKYGRSTIPQDAQDSINKNKVALKVGPEYGAGCLSAPLALRHRLTPPAPSSSSCLGPTGYAHWQGTSVAEPDVAENL